MALSSKINIMFDSNKFRMYDYCLNMGYKIRKTTKL